MKKYFLFVLLVVITMPLFSQFNGGIGDGVDRSLVIQTNLNGIIGGIIPLYQGGSGDGVNNNSISAYLDGTNISAIFSGGQGDGHVKIAGSFYLNGTNIADLYSGGSGDGFDKKQYGGFLNDIGAIVLYNGGSGDGFDKNSFNGLLDGVPTSAFYSGGEGDGFTKAQVQSFLNGLSLDAIYSGGGGDGFAKAEFSGTLIALPIQLLSFDAVAKETYVLVKWVTESEKDNSFFTIERSQNGVMFNNLVVVPSKGNGSTIQTYTENDNNPLQGRSYYRLKWTDINGKSEYSGIRTVLFNQKDGKDFLLFPNPNNGKNIFVELDGVTNNEKISLSVADIQGKTIYQTEKPVFNGDRIIINLPQQLAKGSYVVRINRNGEASAKVLVVQ